MATLIKSNPAIIISTDFVKDFYEGKIKRECDEDCPDDCDVDHGYYELPIEFTKIFEDP